MNAQKCGLLLAVAIFALLILAQPVWAEDGFSLLPPISSGKVCLKVKASRKSLAFTRNPEVRIKKDEPVRLRLEALPANAEEGNGCRVHLEVIDGATPAKEHLLRCNSNIGISSTVVLKCDEPFTVAIKPGSVTTIEYTQYRPTPLGEAALTTPINAEKGGQTFRRDSDGRLEMIQLELQIQ
jgi:hypothetical protein